MTKLNENRKENIQPRPPVVVVVGHIDHGKTALLDSIRKSRVREKESGGITQHIGAYEVEKEGRKITFIDTPGHEAFSQMRSRGARVADIAVLVVAADEGVKPQTKEAISHIKKSGVPIIVALNKIDKPEANPDKVKGELAKNDILVESMGGKIPSIETSAKEGKGITELLEIILLVAEMENLKGDINKPGEGAVIEAYLDAKRGPTATLLLRDGALNKGDIVATPSTSGKIKILENFQGDLIEKSLPSMPIIVLGLNSVPQVGEKFKVFPDMESALKYVEKKERKAEKAEVIFVEPGKKVLNIILKADVLGILEAIEGMIKILPQERVLLRVLKSEVGDINESDIKLAQSSRASIFGFRVKVNSSLLRIAEREKVRIITFEVIYELVQGIRQVMERVMKSEKVRVDLGKMKALVIFLTEKNRQIVGGKILEGEIKKGTLIEVLRNDELIGRGRLISLQKEKKNIESARKGEEIGILYEGDVKIEEKDTLLIYLEEKHKGEL
ncbi:MAG: translation initiation factor IF-2 [Parcubacteria group bacterium]|nr:translation initiation factor IF-2 [Parcubacteria group bacterium]|tara:strand:- start:7616 stop:9121 length:1506 start_codon:yes stop_codon:yes gene_type:complete